MARVLTGPDEPADAGEQRLPASFYRRSAATVAKGLIGMRLLHDGVGGIVVEAEAYDEEDPASHSHRGRTPRNAPMFGPAGHAYVYFSYGAHWCFNVVTGRDGSGQAVLIRALEPTHGLEEMRRRRREERPLEKARRDLARGPGRLTQALKIDKTLDGTSLLEGPLGIWRPPPSVIRRYRPIAATRRVGISKGVETKWRFCAAPSLFLSRSLRDR